MNAKTFAPWWICRVGFLGKVIHRPGYWLKLKEQGINREAQRLDRTVRLVHAKVSFKNVKNAIPVD